jgi:2-oxoglutarate dehydrogenase E2 component (dihydrolipoamide succinyltransferase)
MSIDINVPTLGESVSDATIARWIKKAGDAVAADEPIVELETDKVTLEVPSPVAGKLGEIIAAEGETVEVGALLARVEEGAAGAKPAPKQQAPKQRHQNQRQQKRPMKPRPRLWRRHLRQRQLTTLTCHLQCGGWLMNINSIRQILRQQVLAGV